jgi:hypothetical protein
MDKTDCIFGSPHLSNNIVSFYLVTRNFDVLSYVRFYPRMIHDFTRLIPVVRVLYQVLSICADVFPAFFGTVILASFYFIIEHLIVTLGKGWVTAQQNIKNYSDRPVINAAIVTVANQHFRSELTRCPPGLTLSH